MNTILAIQNLQVLGIPWKIVYTEEYETVAEAKKREKKIKAMKPRKYIEELIAKGRASRS